MKSIRTLHTFLASIIILCLFVSIVQAEGETEKPLHLIIVEKTELGLENNLIAKNYDVVSSDNNSISIIVSEKEIEELKLSGLNILKDIKGGPLKNKFNSSLSKSQIPAQYPSLDGLISAMNTAASTYPAIAKVYDLTQLYNMPTTYEGRHMYIIKISKNVSVDEDEPDVLIVSNHHAREIVTPLIALEAIKKFTEGYGNISQITNLVNNNEIWIAPTWNPDGYNHVYNTDYNWRKNRHVFPSGIGVDLNRNYPALWYSPNSGSNSVSSNNYKGPSPASEPETQTMIAFGQDQRFEKLIDYHSRGQETLYGYAQPTHPFDSWLGSEAVKISTNSGYFENTRRPSADGENYQWHLAMFGTYAFLIETHTLFQPTYSSAQSEVAKVWPGILYVLEKKIPLTGKITDQATGNPIKANIELVGLNFQNDEEYGSDLDYGRYNLMIPYGDYSIKFSADGYQTKTIPFTINYNDEQVLNLQLNSNTTDIKTSTNNVPDEFILFQNYPNPFNPSTTISYNLSEQGWVKIKIFDTMGREIQTIVNESQSAGQHSINYNAFGLTSGVYIYSLQSEKHFQIRKMLLMK